MSTVNFTGAAQDDASVQKTLAMALCSGLSSAKWGEVVFETSQEVLTGGQNLLKKELPSDTERVQ